MIIYVMVNDVKNDVLNDNYVRLMIYSMFVDNIYDFMLLDVWGFSLKIFFTNLIIYCIIKLYIIIKFC